MSADPAPLRAGRRSFLIQSGQLAAGAALVCLLPALPGRASPQESQELIRSIIGDASLQPGRVNLDVPPLVENGNTVPLTVSVDSPMTEADHVKAIHIFNEKNPQPNVLSIRFGPRAGKAAIS